MFRFSPPSGISQIRTCRRQTGHWLNEQGQGVPQRALFLGQAEGSTCWLRAVDRDLEGVRSSRDSKEHPWLTSPLTSGSIKVKTINLVFTYFFLFGSNVAQAGLTM